MRICDDAGKGNRAVLAEGTAKQIFRLRFYPVGIECLKCDSKIKDYPVSYVTIYGKISAGSDCRCFSRPQLPASTSVTAPD